MKEAIQDLLNFQQPIKENSHKDVKPLHLPAINL